MTKGTLPRGPGPKSKAFGGGRDAIAIVGMSGRFPGAEDVEQLWNNLLSARNSISHFTEDELDPSIPEDVRSHPEYVARVASSVMPTSSTTASSG